MTSILTKLRSVAKQVLHPAQKETPVTEFTYDSLPWIDKSDADIDAFVKQFPAAPATEPIRRTINGADVFVNPTMPDQEDIFDRGKTM